MSRLGVQTSHGQHTKHRTQCPDPVSCHWHTNPTGEGRISHPCLAIPPLKHAKSHTPLPPSIPAGLTVTHITPQPHPKPVTSPHICWLPHRFAHTWLVLHIQMYMPSDFISRSVCSLQLRLADITAQRGYAPIPDQPLPEVTSRAPSINRGRMAPPQHIHQPLA